MKKRSLLGCCVLGLAITASALQASPVLTAAGSALGFNLTTIITDAPGSTTDYAILGTAVTPNGNIIFNSSYDNMNYVIANRDNQVFTNPGTILAASPDPGFPTAFAVSNGSVWASGGWPYGGALRKLDNDGNTIAIYTNIPVSTGIWTNPSNGHIIGISYDKVLDIDVSGATPTSTVIQSGSYADGVTVSQDGTKVYLGSSGNNVIDLTSPNYAVSNFGPVTDISALGVISSNNTLNGMLVVTTASGNIVLVDPVTNTQTLLSSGGGYHDYVGNDPTTGTLLVGSSNSILRLSCGVGCGIGSDPAPSVHSDFVEAAAVANAPEPSSVGFACLAMAAFFVMCLRKRFAQRA